MDIDARKISESDLVRRLNEINEKDVVKIDISNNERGIFYSFNKDEKQGYILTLISYLSLPKDSSKNPVYIEKSMFRFLKNEKLAPQKFCYVDSEIVKPGEEEYENLDKKLRGIFYLIWNPI